jgi:hypothetical protein
VADTTIATIDAAGKLNGVRNGITEVYGLFNGNIDTLVAKVQIPASKPLRFDDFIQDYDTRWSMKASNSKWEATLQNQEDPATLYLNFTGGRQANIKWESGQTLYSAPNELIFRLTPQGDLISKITIGLTANNGVTTINFSTEDILSDQQMDVVVRLDSLFGAKNDIAIYPVVLDFITLAFNTSADKKEYEIPFHGIYLTYNNHGNMTNVDQLIDNTSKEKTAGSKFIKDGQMYILYHGEVYNILGVKIK